MVGVKPFKAYYYNDVNTGDLSKQLAPPYDVISEKERDLLYKESMFNVVRLILGREEVGDGGRDNRFIRARGYLKQFIKGKKLIQTEKPVLYIYSIEFEYKGRLFTRMGVVALVKLTDFSKKQVLPHEMTFKKYTEERYNFLKACKSNFWPVFSIYKGDERVQKVMQEYASKTPLLTANDADGFFHRVWAVNDEPDITAFEKILKEKPVIIADGHHRYKTALQYSKGSKDKGSKYVMMYLVDSGDPGLIILPSHRIVEKLRTCDINYILEKLVPFFNIERFDFLDENERKARGKFLKAVDAVAHRIGMFVKGTNAYFLLTLKPGLKPEKLIKGKYCADWKKLDVSILHKLIISECLGAEDEGNITYTKNPEEGIQKVHDETADAFFVLQAPSVRELEHVTSCGDILPHKATYFFPKPLSGMLIYKHDSSKV
jgi:uncharacterized protein (DUF1015 family)